LRSGSVKNSSHPRSITASSELSTFSNGGDGSEMASITFLGATLLVDVAEENTSLASTVDVIEPANSVTEGATLALLGLGLLGIGIGGRTRPGRRKRIGSVAPFHENGSISFTAIQLGQVATSTRHRRCVSRRIQEAARSRDATRPKGAQA
jgi:hypothetical protein